MAILCISLLETSIGSYSDAKLVIDKVLQNAKSLDDKLQAYLHQLLCEIEESSDYPRGLIDGVRILNLYGFGIPAAITNTCLMKEGVKLKMAFRNRSYHILVDLPVKDDPIFHLFMHVQKCALFTSNVKFVKVLAWKSIQHAIKRGMGRHIPLIMAFLASSLAKEGNVKTAQEIGHVSVALCDKISDDVEICATTQFIAHADVLPLLQSFRSSVEPLLQCHKDVKLVGGWVEAILGAMVAYFNCVFASGLAGPAAGVKADTS